MQTQANQRSGSQSRYASPTSTTTTTTTTINPRTTIQLYGANSTNTSPTSTYQPSHLTAPNPPATSNTQNFNNAPVNSSFLVNYAPPRQLHPPKSPLYRPAVLRTTERTSRPGTANGGNLQQQHQIGHNPSSSISSLNSTNSNSDGTKEGAQSLAIFGGGAEMFSNVFGNMGMTPALRAVPEWEEQIEKPVTGVPNRDHWKNDALSTTCDLPLCAKSFSLFERRHHCRKCGQIFCASHTSHYVRLDQDCEFHPQGTMSRLCDCCFDEYKRLVAQRRASSASSTSTGTSSSSGGSTVPNSPIVGKGVGVNGMGVGGKGQDAFGAKAGSSYVGSVPRDWSWSTF